MIKLINGSAGAGKTEYAIDQIKLAVEAGKKVMYTGPSTDLCNAFAKRLKNKTGIKALVIHSKSNCPHGVSPEIVSRINNPRNKHSVVIITAQSYASNIGALDLDNYLVVIDEYPQIISRIKVPLDTNGGVSIDNWFDFDEETGELLLQPSLDTVTHFATANRAINDIASMIKRKVANVYLEDMELKSSKRQYIDTYAIVNQKFFTQDMIIMGANAESSLCYHYLTKCNMIDEVVTLKPRVDNHASDKIRFYSTIENETSINMKRTRPTQFIAAVTPLHEIFKTHETLLLKNSNNKDPFNYDDGNYIELSHNCHGNDDYKHIHNILITTDINPSPALLRVASDRLGMTKDELIAAMQTELDYQAIMRTAIRAQTELAQNVHIGIPCHARAHRLRKFFPNAIFTRVDNLKFTNVRGKAKVKKKETIPGVDRTKVTRMRKIAMQNPSYYGDRTDFILSAGTRDIIVKEWYIEYMTNGKRNEKV